jgi:hypothetical protein
MTRATARSALAITPVLALLGVPAASSHGTLSCSPGSTDVACRVRPTLTLKTPSSAPAHTVSNGNPNHLPPPSTLSVASLGATDFYLGTVAVCQAIDPDKHGTRIQTRSPAGYLFTQGGGQSNCTIRGSYVVLFGTVRVAAARRASNAISQAQSLPAFFAALEAVGERPTQFRAALVPGRSFVAAVLGGSLLIRLPDDRNTVLQSGTELQVVLRPDNTIDSTTNAPAKFTPEEQRLFAVQLKKLG